MALARRLANSAASADLDPFPTTHMLQTIQSTLFPRMFRELILKSTAVLLAAITLAGCSAGAKKAGILGRADRYFQAGEYDKAKIEYLNLLRLENQNVKALQQLGLIWFEEGAPIRAIPYLYRVRELAPKNIPARTKLGLALMQVNDFQEARQEALSVLEQDPANADAIGLLADASQNKEDIAGAEQQLDKFPQKETAAFHLASANLSLRRGEIGGASDQIQQALAADPKSARAHLAMGFIYLLRKDPGRAGPELKSASDLAPLRSDERLKYAEFQAQNGAAEEAKATLRAMTKETPDYLLAWRTLAQIAFGEKKYDESLALLQNIVTRDPDNPEAALLQSKIWLAKGDGAKSLAVLDRLNQTYPNNAIIKYQLAQAYLANNNPLQATTALEQVVAARPNFAEAILQLAQLNLQSGKTLPVMSALEELLKKRPDLPQARLLLASAYQAVGRFDDAAKLFREQIKAEPKSADPYFLLGVVLRGQKKSEEARQAFEKASELAPDNILPVEQLVDLDLESKNFASAIRRAQEQLEKTPNSAAAHYVEGKIHALRGEWEQAEAAFKKAIDLDPNFSKGYELLISTYFAANKLPDAVAQLESLLSKNPGDSRALFILALVHERQSDFAKAREDYERLLSTKPNFVPALNNLAYLDGEHFNDLDKAYELAQKAHTLLPGDGATADTLGWVLYKRSDYQQALIFLQEAAAKATDNPVVQFHLGMAFYMTGQPDAARLAFERTARAQTDFPEKAEAQKRLASLQGSTVGKGETSTSELEARVKQQPNDVVLLQRLAEAYEKQGDNTKSAAAYETALKVNPKLPAVAIKLAQLYAGPLQSPDKAFQLAKKARELAPNDAQAAGVLGSIAFQTGNLTWAYGLLKERVRRAADDPQVLHDLALTAYFLGKLPEARETMQRALNTKPDAAQSLDAKRFLAMTALNEPSPEAVGARPEIEQILKEQPNYVPALMAQAAIGVQEKNLNAAAVIYSEVLRKYPDFAPAQKRLAAIYADDPKNLAKAYDLAMKARKVMPGDPEAARILGELTFKRNEFPYAAQLFSESNSKQPLPATDLYYWGMAQIKSRQEAEGRKTLEQALSAGLSEPLAGEARKRLAEEQKR